jgi:methyl-accepting chemotaxis protein
LAVLNQLSEVENAMLGSLTVRKKLLLVAVLVAFTLIAIIALEEFAKSKITELEDAALEAQQAEVEMMLLRHEQQQFLSSLDINYLTQFQKTQAALVTRTDKLGEKLLQMGMDSTPAEDLGEVIIDYSIAFSDIVVLQQEIGLNPKDGLYGKLRESVHAIEDKLSNYDEDALFSQMLMLRRHEKDFMLRLDMKYIDKFNNGISDFKQTLASSFIPAGERNQILTLLGQYQSDFLALAKASEQKGLNADSGLLGEMYQTVEQSETALNALDEEIQNDVPKLSQRYELIMILVSAVLGISILWLIVMISRSIVNPLQSLSNTMREVQQSKNLNIRVDDTGTDELAEMAKSFNAMTSAFQSLIQDVLQSAETVSAAAEQLSVVSQQSRQGVLNQQSSSEQVATAMNEMTATVQEVARYAADAAEASKSSDDETVKGKTLVQKTVSGIKQLASQSADNADAIKRLQQESDNIGTVLSVIQEIAEQTNLLALNAAIEAARAGDSGRGFAVVADEVRTLAQRSQQSTEEIKTIIERLQSGANHCVDAMLQGKDQVEATVVLVEDAGQSLDAIADRVRSILDMNTHIASAAEEQSAVAEDINRNVNQIAQVAEENAESSSQTTETSQSLAKLATDLQGLISRFKV